MGDPGITPTGLDCVGCLACFTCGLCTGTWVTYIGAAGLVSGASLGSW